MAELNSPPALDDSGFPPTYPFAIVAMVLGVGGREMAAGLGQRRGRQACGGRVVVGSQPLGWNAWLNE